jgi:hypothetical protein
MGLLDSTTQQAYYQGNDYGNYQFTSLADIIDQFVVVYVGEDKLIRNASRTDVGFHAQRALQELSFDTFKSTKAQEIVVPASLHMVLPQDYVNYTKISTVDSAGIKHLLYPTSKTSNPYSVRQDDLGNYTFAAADPALANTNFDNLLFGWTHSSTHSQNANDSIQVVNGELAFVHYLYNGWTKNSSFIYSAWQQIDVSDLNTLDLSAKGTAQDTDVSMAGGTLRIGVSTVAPGNNIVNYPGSSSYATSNTNPPWAQTLDGDNAVLEWTPGEDDLTKSLEETSAINVSSYNTVWLLITSFVDLTTTTGFGTNSIDDITLTNIEAPLTLQTDSPGSSTAWSNYQSGAVTENQDDYIDDTYWPMEGSRYGLDPQHAQANGSYFIDQRSGKIHFSSNIAGKTVILDYISDSLGTDGEMQVHKFAEEAMYAWISHAILSGKANIPEYQVNRLKKERFAAIRTAKLRLSNLKLEEITQILRGKSKQIKH